MGCEAARKQFVQGLVLQYHDDAPMEKRRIVLTDEQIKANADFCFRDSAVLSLHP